MCCIGHGGIRVPGSSGIYSGGWPVVQGVTNIIESDTRASNSEDQEDDSLFFFLVAVCTQVWWHDERHFSGRAAAATHLRFSQQ